MKLLITSKALRKVLILFMLVVGIVFVAGSNQATQNVLADSVCCGSCEIPPGDSTELVPYCTDLCGASSGTCYDTCYDRVYHCWMFCHECFNPSPCGGTSQNWNDYCWSIGYDYCNGGQCANY